ncbi:MAG TPA: hypothetical protein VFZ17_07465 [Acidimicrobiia bacterium]|nr:hypothetical protein [Acidimicrobiia bacterium]
MIPSDEHGERIAALIREQHGVVETIGGLGDDDERRRELWARVLELQEQIAEQINEVGFEP